MWTGVSGQREGTGESNTRRQGRREKEKQHVAKHMLGTLQRSVLTGAHLFPSRTQESQSRVVWSSADPHAFAPACVDSTCVDSSQDDVH